MLSRSLRICLSALLLGGAVSTAGAELTGVAAPDFVLRSVDGANRRLSEYRGQVVMLGFWASWCGECRSQLEALSGLYGKYRGAGFELLSVSLDRDRDDVEDTTRAVDASFPVLHDGEGAAGETYDVRSMPYLLLIDRDGVVRDEFTGYRRGDEAKYLERLRALLNE